MTHQNGHKRTGFTAATVNPNSRVKLPFEHTPNASKVNPKLLSYPRRVCPARRWRVLKELALLLGILFALLIGGAATYPF